MEPLLQLEHVSKGFMLTGKRRVQALQDVNLQVMKGETLGIVGESGCGKSTLARVIMGVYPKIEGSLYFHGEKLDLRRRKHRLAFAKKVQMVFQDPYSSLNPRMTVGDIVAENLVIQHNLTKKEREARVFELLESVGLQKAHAGRFPNEFSGGQRQRIGIARALALKPELLICDEPVAALDVSIQSQIMNLLKGLGKETGLTYIFIAHDMNMVHYLSDRVAVMYLGHIMEIGSTKEIYSTPLHPYTRLLLESVLTVESREQPISGKRVGADEISLSAGSVTGCPFAGLCKCAEERCMNEKPALKEIFGGHLAACHYADQNR